MGFGSRAGVFVGAQVPQDGRVNRVGVCTVPQVVFQFAMQRVIVPLAGTTSREHMEQDRNCVDFWLEEAEHDRIEHVVSR